MYTEHQIQNQIRDRFNYSSDVTLFRANVGSGWTGNSCHHLDGTVTIYNPRWFKTGLPVGFPDLFGYKTETITPDMVGKKIARFAFIEVKRPKGKASTEQREMIKQLIDDGCLGGIAHSVDEAERLMKNEH